MVNTAEKQQHAQDERIILSMFTCDIPCIAWHLFENWWTLSRTARWIGVSRGAHQTVRQPRPESLDTVSHQTGRCFLGHLTIRCRMPALVLFAMMHQLCNDGHYNDLWMGRRVTDSRSVALVQSSSKLLHVMETSFLWACRPPTSTHSLCAMFPCKIRQRC